MLAHNTGPDWPFACTDLQTEKVLKNEKRAGTMLSHSTGPDWPFTCTDLQAEYDLLAAVNDFLIHSVDLQLAGCRRFDFYALTFTDGTSDGRHDGLIFMGGRVPHRCIDMRFQRDSPSFRLYCYYNTTSAICQA